MVVAVANAVANADNADDNADDAAAADGVWFDESVISYTVPPYFCVSRVFYEWRRIVKM